MYVDGFKFLRRLAKVKIIKNSSGNIIQEVVQEDEQ